MGLSTSILLTIALAPLAGCVLAGFLGKFLGRAGSHSVTILGVAVSCALSFYVLYQLTMGGAAEYNQNIYTWFQIGPFNASVGFMVDRLTALMLVVVSFVSLLVHVYTIGYMADDDGYTRFFSYISLFTFSMFMLVMSNNFLQLFFGWEAVGLVSYLLIGFWYKRPTAIFANLKAFMVNRVGDFGFLLGIAAVLYFLGTLDYATAFSGASGLAGQHLQITANTQWDAATVICILLFVGAMGKSAQVPLHTWLPDAMEGPTPVSALIHAATMVTAGVFMLARLSPLFELSHTALLIVTFIGAITAFFAATVGLVQNDIKRVIAYSTCSQLGYMFVALGVGAYGVAIFHLFTHAFFKALLFLGSGSVIHAVSDEQDMRKMGGLRKLIPSTYWTMIIGTLALTGVGIPATIIGTAGFFSKDAIIEASFVGQNSVAGFAFVLLVIAALFTSFYSWRVIFMTFHGEPRASHEVMHHVHESPPVMLIPLYVLAAGSLFAGVLFAHYFVGEGYAEFWKTALFTLPDNHVLHAMHEVPLWVQLAPIIVTVIGFLLAYQFYIRDPQMPKNLAAQHRGLYAFLLNKWYFDELYDFLFVRGAKRLGHFLWKTGDGRIIDGIGPDGVSARVIDVTNRVVKLQTGYLYHYAFAMLIGVAALVTWMML